jgi:uncharacterized protein YyaL (SSP411 family)
LAADTDREEPVRWAHIRKTLYAHRERRIRPLLDDKVLTDWNGLMIASLARASRLLSAPVLLEQAEAAWRFVRRHLCHGQNRLYKRFRNGNAGLPAHLDDYAFMTWAALELYQATLDADYLEQAIAWTDVADEEFWDEGGGGYFFSAPDDSLVVRQKMVYDGAIASGNSFMARNLAVLFHMTGQVRWRDRYDALVRAMAQMVNRFGAGSAMLLIAEEVMHGPTENLVLSVGDANMGSNADLIAPLMGSFLPSLLWLGLPGSQRARIGRLAPFTEDYPASAESSLYWCRQFVCEQPVVGDADIQARVAACLAQSAPSS